jgi:hypothetical protein
VRSVDIVPVRTSPNGLNRISFTLTPLLLVAALALPKWSPCSQYTVPLVALVVRLRMAMR